jgi:3-hexulose-6-phosphate synthase / 6-phospho-3-hexuloisomerase
MQEKTKCLRKDILCGFSSVSVTTVSDIFEQLGIANRVFFGFRQTISGKRLVGFAVTIKVANGNRGDFEKSDYNFEQIAALINEGDVAVFDNGGAPTASLGDLTATYLKKRGAAGVLVDGGVRDVESLRELGMPVFARHFVPFSGVGKMKLVSLNRPVLCNGISIHPGDIIMADDNGVAAVPAGQCEEILKLALEKEEKEKLIMEAIKNGMSLMEAINMQKT